jgi:hypothetical protein
MSRFDAVSALLNLDDDGEALMQARTRADTGTAYRGVPLSFSHGRA